MIAIGIVLSLVGLAYLCWLLFVVAAYALPIFVGVTAGLVAYDSGAGPVGTMIVGAIAGALALMAGQIAFTVVRSFLVRAAIALIFAMPTAVAGYHAAYGLVSLGGAAEGWRQAMAVMGALVVAAITGTRLVLDASPDEGRGAGAVAQLPAGRR